MKRIAVGLHATDSLDVYLKASLEPNGNRNYLVDFLMMFTERRTYVILEACPGLSSLFGVCLSDLGRGILMIVEEE